MARNVPRFAARRRAGSVTLVSLCLTATLGIALGSYLALCNRSAQFSTRTLNREKARELALVGLEEALWALNQDNWTSSGSSSNTAWTTSGANRSVTLSYSLPGGLTGQNVLTIANYASTGPTWPTITSASTVTLSDGQVFTKTLQAGAQNAPLFANAIASAEGEVSFVAGGTVDSWNSDPDNNSATPAVAYSFTAGNAANYNAVVAGCGTGTNGVTLTQATVRGYVTTSGKPISYSTSGSPAGSVIGPATAAGVSVDSARLGKSAFVPVSPAFAVTQPSTEGGNFGGLVFNIIALINQITNHPNREVFQTNGNHQIHGIPLLSPSITIDRSLKLIVKGDLTLANLGRITITPTGSLEIFVEGNLVIGGDGVINQTNDPRKLAIYCTSAPGESGVIYSTTQNFCGVIYCENGSIEIKQNVVIHGALLSRQGVRFTTNATAPVIHYDTALRQVRFAGVKTPYLLQGMTEQ
ncbi:MAG TPA: hypothetical protein VM029_17135 [Opitutaceae bacterium]|nr:hypothetical protein [Opitutaceae bacterium]